MIGGHHISRHQKRSKLWKKAGSILFLMGGGLVVEETGSAMKDPVTGGECRCIPGGGNCQRGKRGAFFDIGKKRSLQEEKNAYSAERGGGRQYVRCADSEKACFNP